MSIFLGKVNEDESILHVTSSPITNPGSLRDNNYSHTIFNSKLNMVTVKQSHTLEPMIGHFVDSSDIEVVYPKINTTDPGTVPHLKVTIPQNIVDLMSTNLYNINIATDFTYTPTSTPGTEAIWVPNTSGTVNFVEYLDTLGNLDFDNNYSKDFNDSSLKYGFYPSTTTTEDILSYNYGGPIKSTPDNVMLMGGSAWYEVVQGYDVSQFSVLGSFMSLFTIEGYTINSLTITIDIVDIKVNGREFVNDNPDSSGGVLVSRDQFTVGSLNVHDVPFYSHVVSDNVASIWVPTSAVEDTFIASAREDLYANLLELPPYLVINKSQLLGRGNYRLMCLHDSHSHIHYMKELGEYRVYQNRYETPTITEDHTIEYYHSVLNSTLDVFELVNSDVTTELIEYEFLLQENKILKRYNNEAYYICNSDIRDSGVTLTTPSNSTVQTTISEYTTPEYIEQTGGVYVYATTSETLIDSAIPTTIAAAGPRQGGLCACLLKDSLGTIVIKAVVPLVVGESRPLYFRSSKVVISNIHYRTPGAVVEELRVELVDDRLKLFHNYSGVILDADYGAGERPTNMSNYSISLRLL